MGEGDRRSAAQPRRESEGDAETRITPLHIALWNGNLQQIEVGLMSEPQALETRDPRGNRALHLALKFAHRNSTDIVKKLLAAGARVRSRDLEGWKAVHHAVASENEDLLGILVQREKAQAPGLLHKKIMDVAPRLADVPDFYCEILVDVSSWLPGLSRVLPSDTVKIWKRGGDLRFDITLVGLENGTWQRGNLSFLLLGNDCQFLCVDHDARTCVNLLTPGNQLETEDLASMVHFLMTTSIVTTEMDTSALTFSRQRTWSAKSGALKDVGAWKHCGVYDMTGMVVVLRLRRPQNKHHKAPDKSGNVQSSRTTDTIAALEAAANEPEEPYDEVVIPPNSDHVVSTEVAANETVKWRFRVESCDVRFSVRFLSEDCSGEAEEEVVMPTRLSSDHEHGGSFTAPTAGTVVLRWDNSYSIFRQKHIHFQLSVAPSDATRTESERCESHRTSEQLVTFEQWFGVAINQLPRELQALRPKHRIMVHTQPPSRTIAKAFSATMYASSSFPLSVEQFLPIVEVLSKTTSAFENVREFFNARLEGGFPVQFCFPVLPTISATFRFNRMELTSPDAALFTVPSHFARLEEDLLSPRMHHEMLQNLTVV